jgi:hypothetical protein
MTPAHHTKAVLSEDGKLSLDQLPFRAGQTVEVIVLPVPQPSVADHPLKGSVLRYDRPFDPVAEEDWSGLK